MTGAESKRSAMQQQAEHGEDLVPDESQGPYFPYNRRERYPKRLKVDFRRLPVRIAERETEMSSSYFFVIDVL